MTEVFISRGGQPGGSEAAISRVRRARAKTSARKHWWQDRTPEHAHKNNFGLGEGNIQRTLEKTVVWFLTSANL